MGSALDETVRPKTPERSAAVKRVRELVEYCRSQGYRPNEVVQIIEGLS
jgi:hypothetical protein